MARETENRKLKTSMRKGQSEMLEYVFLTFLIMVVVVAIILFLTGWQATQLTFEKSKAITGRALFLLKYISDSPLVVRDVAQFDDRKLAALSEMGPAGCSELGKLTGGGSWFFEVSIPGEPVCDPGESDCGSWAFCKKEGRYTAFTLPVNVYRTVDKFTATDFLSSTKLAVLTVGVYQS